MSNDLVYKLKQRTYAQPLPDDAGDLQELYDLAMQARAGNWCENHIRRDIVQLLNHIFKTAQVGIEVDNYYRELA